MLLKAEGKSYQSLVKDAYQTRDNYEAFLQELTLAEKAVNRAAIQTVGKTETTSELISKMETVTDGIRRKEAGAISDFEFSKVLRYITLLYRL